MTAETPQDPPDDLDEVLKEIDEILEEVAG